MLRGARFLRLRRGARGAGGRTGPRWTDKCRAGRDGGGDAWRTSRCCWSTDRDTSTSAEFEGSAKDGNRSSTTGIWAGAVWKLQDGASGSSIVRASGEIGVEVRAAKGDAGSTCRGRDRRLGTRLQRATQGRQRARAQIGCLSRRREQVTHSGRVECAGRVQRRGYCLLDGTRCPPQTTTFDNAPLGASWSRCPVRSARSCFVPVSMVVMARLVTPEQFGLVGMVTAITGFLALFRDGGLSQATVQRAEHSGAADIDLVLDQRRTRRGLVRVRLQLLAPAIAAFFSEPRLILITMRWAALPLRRRWRSAPGAADASDEVRTSGQDRSHVPGRKHRELESESRWQVVVTGRWSRWR